MTTEKEKNHFYTKMKHVNDFLYSEHNFKTPDHTLTIDESIESIKNESKTTNMEAFEHTIDFFKKAKEQLRQKGEI
ncbi:Uncharacterised protein [Staphylococcus petrasii]|uniref:Uncharacterized protein n=1 Tax=Staphylococcus petrasii TaxID=1276936 RepID=A0A380G2H7_9STAP|nr:hypothetical protein [Staphylococcus petrasii]MCI2773257.1 hypothetical protein [Staphylococcus petrasii]PNZ30312.1 hypothetical protein CD137_05410 [Staphylococcus petrasii]TGE12536.1 hypothetical protein E2557_05355 [Staphylococcus petrasii]TGE18407.1 hypothetical protein BJR09_03310 [Staphylococcus petrasii]SUM44443.1 Uncharacterised protein [Staphylococcus petrasii]